MKKIATLILCFVISQLAFSQGKETIEWVKVEGGTFLMGCEKTEADCYPDEEQHAVTVSTFHISKYEITVEQFRYYCHQTGKEMPPAPNFGWQDKAPIVNVTWQQAYDYAKWAGGRLPTEAEWEYAARGGKYSKGYTYSGGNDALEVGWCYENSNKTTHPVGEKKANELGLYDMSGNAWEWCNDNYEIYYYKNSPQKNPQGPATGIGKVNRGGCYNFDYRLMKNSHRRGSGEESTGTGTGFRIVK
ncbi:MAG: SUMF1/EgtB/PvdO family nonheme iron enzyme [Bacteroidales bacterium]|nr:SUMF1/EgtB/PvdO family nonheme iron enzyme [Bacteroidales bacterium]